MDWLKKKSTIKVKQNHIHIPQAVVKINLLLDQSHTCQYNMSFIEPIH